MKGCSLLIASALLLVSNGANACGTRLPDAQAKINAEESVQLRRLAQETAHAAEAVFIGTVTDLKRPPYGTIKLGSATLSVDETLKGESARVRTVQWRDKGVLSCKESAMFLNVGFRRSGKYIIYIRDGEVARAGAADELRNGLLTLEQERAIASGISDN